MNRSSHTGQTLLGLQIGPALALLLALSGTVGISFVTFLVGYVKYCDGTASGYCAQRSGSALPWWAAAVLIPTIPLVVTALATKKWRWWLVAAGLAAILSMGLMLTLLITQN